MKQHFKNLKFVLLVLAVLAVPVLAQTPVKKAINETTLKEFLSFYQPYARNTAQNLSEANRSSRELQVWVSDKMAELLSIDPKTASFKLNQSRSLFSADAYNNYLLALGALPYAEQIRNGQVQIAAVVNSMPALLSSGAVAGRYIWVFEINVLITATPARASITVNGPKNVQAVYRVQLARAPTAPPPHNVIFDIWQTKTSGSSEETQKQSEKTPVVVN